MAWEVPKIWKNKTCWIIGGGTSITEQFGIPDDVVADVKAGKVPISAYSPYMEPLHDAHVIGINGAFRIGSWIDFCFFGDKNWFFDNKKELELFEGISISCANFMGRPRWQTPRIRHIEQDPKQFGISADPKKVCWNLNSGAAAINVAYHTGCSRVVLLGFDMKLINGNGHWHNLYNGKTNMPFHRHLKSFDFIASDAKELGLEIINASPNSAITQFEKAQVKDLI